MVQKLAVVCAIEAAIVAVLAVQVFGASTAPSLAPRPSPANAPAAAAQPAAGPAALAPAANATANAGEPTRSEVVAKLVAGAGLGVLLTGSMRLRDGKPADAWLQATLDKESAGAAAAADGSYAMFGLRPGEWKIDVRGQSILEQSTSVVITDEAVQHRDFVLDPSFAVKVLVVTPDGADATSALRKAVFAMRNFVAAGQRDRFPERLAPTENETVFVGDAKWQGEMNPKDGFAGTLYLTSLPAHVALLQRHLVLEQQVVQPGQQEVKFVVDVEAMKKLAASATVRVLDAASGEPLANAQVMLTRSFRPVDAQGRIELAGLPPGLLRCEISAAEHESMSTLVRVEVGQRLDLGDVRLGAEVRLQGTVLDADGKPANAELQWTELKWRTAPVAFRQNMSSRTDAEGKFTLWRTGAGTVALSAFDKDGNVARGVFENPPATPIVLRLAKACEGTITRPSDPTRAFTVTLFDEAKRATAAVALEARTTTFQLKMPAGRYTFEVHDEQSRLVQGGTLEFGATPCTLEIR